MKAIAGPTTNGAGAASAAVPASRKKPKPLLLPEPTTLMQAIIAASSRPDIDVGKIRELVELQKAMQLAEWGRAFNEAMVACQADLQPVARNRSNEQTSSRYADLAKLAEEALPVIHRHGFAITFSEADTSRPSHIGVAVSVRHREGHTERFTFQVPVDLRGFKGTPDKTAIHGWGSALTYCRRYSLLCAFNVIVAGDDDGHAAGGKPKSAYQARRDNDYPRVERRIRGARAMADLEAVWREEWPTIQAWPERWRQHITEEKNNRKAALDPMTAFEDSLRYLDREGGL